MKKLDRVWAAIKAVLEARLFKNYRQNYTDLIMENNGIVLYIRNDDGNIVLNDNNQPSLEEDKVCFDDDAVPGTRFYWENLIKFDDALN